MKVSKAKVQDMMYTSYENFQTRLRFGERDIGQIVRRGKTVGLKRTVKTEFMFRRNVALGITEDLFAGNVRALISQVAGHVTKHINEGKMELPADGSPKQVEPDVDEDTDTPAPRM